MHDIDEEIKKLIDENTDETETQSETDTSSGIDAEKLATVLEEVASKILTLSEESIGKVTVEEATKKALVKKILATQHAASGGD